jgi:hypothetical protein
LAQFLRDVGPSSDQLTVTGCRERRPRGTIVAQGGGRCDAEDLFSSMAVAVEVVVVAAAVLGCTG